MSAASQMIEAVKQAIAEEATAWRHRLSSQHPRLTKDVESAEFFRPEGSQIPASTSLAHTNRCPWDGAVMSTESGLVFQFTQPGALRPAGMPTNMFVDGQLWNTSVGSGSTYIILSCLTDGNLVTSCTIVPRGTPAAPIGIQAGTAPSSFEIDLYAIVLGVALKVIECDNPQAVAVVALETDAPDPVCGAANVVRHYTWVINPTLEGGS